jgi:hypothetical protein
MNAATPLKKLSRLFLLMMATCLLLCSQSFDAANGNAPLQSLDGLWRFDAGDDPPPAQLAFDDITVLTVQRIVAV